MREPGHWRDNTSWQIQSVPLPSRRHRRWRWKARMPQGHWVYFDTWQDAADWLTWVHEAVRLRDLHHGY